jgi:hypothetical protein
MRSRVALLGLVAACASRPPEPAPAPKPPPRSALPGGFEVRGAPVVTGPFLPPEATWRFLVSQLTLLRADASRKREEVLVSFEALAFHATGRDGKRRTWRLPAGIRLEGVPAHVLLGPDLGIRIALPEGMQVVGEEEITVVTAAIGAGGANVQKSRLAAKAGSGFRSISTGG